MDSGKAQNLSDGERYVIALHTLFSLSAIKSYTNWEILNEVKSAGKFDDLVFKSHEKCMLLQAKVHSGTTCTKHFTAIKGDFSIAKYFLSYLTAKKYFEITSNSLILCTAAKLNVADIMDEFGPETKNYADENLQKIFGTEIKKYKIKNEEKIVDKLLSTIKQFQDSFSNKETDKEKKVWKNLDINREDIKSFICFFVVVKENLANIESLITRKLRELNNDLKFKPSDYEYVKYHVEKWSHLPIKKSVPMTKDYLLFIINGENNRLFLHKFVNSKLKFKEENLYEFDSNIICVQPHENIAMHLLKIFRSIENTNGSYLPIEENTLCLMQKIENKFHKMKYTMEYKVICDMIDTFRCDKIKYLVVSFLALDEDKALELYEKICTITKEDPTKKVFIIIKEHQLQNSEISVKVINDKIYFSSLENETKEHIFDKEILFQEEIVTLRKLITKKESVDSEPEFRVQINEIEIDEGLEEIIFSEDKYSIGSNIQAQSKPDEFYITRKLMLNANSENLQKSINNVERTIPILTDSDSESDSDSDSESDFDSDSDSDSYEHIRRDVFREKKFFEKIHKTIVVVIGPPGAGKTTALKQIVSFKKAKDKEDSKLTWVINVDLKKYKQCFQKDSEKTLCNLLYHNENITHYFEEKLMESMDKMLIIDGLDENCPEDIKEIQNILADHNAFQALNISMVIMGAREYDFILKEIRDLHSCEIVRLLPFSRRDGASFLKEYLKPAVNIENDLFKKVKNFAIKFSQSISSTPLSLKMISKIIKNSIRKNDCMESLSKVFNNFSNRYYFYNCYIEAIRDEFAQGDNIYRQAFDRYIDSLRILAANRTFYSRWIVLSFVNVDASLEISKDVLNVGLLKESYGYKMYQFVHKTFEEYFAAEFVWDYLYKNRHSHDLLLEVLDKVFIPAYYKGVLDFFEQILKVNQNEKISEISMEYNSALTKVHWKEDIVRVDNWNYFFIVKLVFDKYTHFYDILKSYDWLVLTKSLYNDRYRQSYAKFFVETGAKVNKVSEIGFIILKMLLLQDRLSNLLYVDRTEWSTFECDNIPEDEYSVDFLKFLTREYNIDLNFCSENGNTIGHYAARYHSLNAIKCLKEQGANLSISNNKKQTLVHVAAQVCAFNVLRYLVEDCKMDVNVSDVDGNLPVHRVVEFGRVDILMYLKEKGANLSISNNKKHTLVHEAAQSGNLEVLQYLVEDCKIDVSVFDDDGNLPAHLAASNNKVWILRYLKSIGSDLNQRNCQGKTSVHFAAAGDAVDVLNLLKDEGNISLNLDLRDKDGDSPSHCAAAKNSLTALKYLKKQGANLSISNKNKYTPVHIAAQYGALDVLRYLVENCKMDINVSTGNGEIPAHLAALYNKVEILRYLISVGSNLNQCNNQRQTLVHLAAAGDAINVLNFLKNECNFSLNLDFRDNDGFTPSHCAASNNALKAIRFLKEHGANLSISNKNKRTPVHEAAQRGALEVLQYLVEDCKMDINVSTYLGDLPAHLAARCNKVETLRYLKSVGSDLNQCNNQGRSLVHMAAAGDAVDVLDFLKNESNFSLNLDLSDNDGFTPSHMAAANNSLKAIKYHKKQGANLSISNKDKYTLVHAAAEYGAIDVLVYLVEECKMDIKVSDNNGNLPAHLAALSNKVEILRYLKSVGSDLNQRNHQGATLVDMAAEAGAVNVLNFLKNECNY
uniref:Uncharacterized protein LOC114343091 n=1 Tax=Diabrotica virgifera virgifera TaxID=50390 RepID=A0A6P7H0Z0_DIAVI